VGCLNCNDCMGIKCDVYKIKEIEKAWNKAIEKPIKLVYKILDKLNALISKG